MAKVFSPEKLGLARGRANLTQEELGIKVGVTGRQISRYETGEQKPRITVIARLADALGVDPDPLYTKDNE